MGEGGSTHQYLTDTDTDKVFRDHCFGGQKGLTNDEKAIKIKIILLKKGMKK